mmetsp:Transcript_15176/g.40268  ORF Transcript_15176/g.40268 Transcript_15176/m.40268 type:complete len:554 (+) Transcript_15176:227-1888(+)
MIGGRRKHICLPGRLGWPSLAGRDHGELGGLVLDVAHAADHVEGGLRDVVAVAREHLLEVVEHLLDVHEGARGAREDLGHEERLRQEALHLAGAGHGELVLLGELVHAQDGDDVLERLVVLEDLLRAARNVVVTLADDGRVKHAGRRVQGIDRGVDAELGDRAREHRGGVQVREGGGRGRVRQVVGRHVHGLHGGDRALLRRGNALLQGRQVSGQGRLVADGARDTAEQGGHLGAGLREAEDVVDEQQHVLALLVTEILGDREAGQGHAGARARRLVHLAVHQGGLGARHLVLLDHAARHHLVVQVVALASALADAGEDAVTTVLQGDVVDELHDNHGLADARAAEEADLASLGVRRQKVDDLDTGLELLSRGVHLRESGRGTVDRVELLGLDGAELVDGLANDVDDAAQSGLADRHRDGRAGVHHRLPAGQAVRAVHRDRAHNVLSQVLGDLQHEAVLEALHLERLQDRRQGALELHVDDGADDLRDPALALELRRLREAAALREGRHGGGEGVARRHARGTAECLRGSGCHGLHGCGFFHSDRDAYALASL